MTPINTVTEITLVYKNKQKASERITITNSSDAHRCIQAGFDADTLALQEQFVCAYLNRANQVLGIYKASVGGITGTVADPRLILSTALKVGASGILLAHNHPSGKLRPSRVDEELTRKIREGAALFDIKVLDHLILEPMGESYFSFADDGLL